MIVVAVVGPIVDLVIDCTVFLLSHAFSMGHEIWVCGVYDICLRNEEVHALARPLIDLPWTLGQPIQKKLCSADVVLMRNDPPFDARYLTLTYILERLDCLLINNPLAVRNNPEKLFRGIGEFSLPTLVSENLFWIRKFAEMHEQVVLKPLYSCGGRGVVMMIGYDEDVVCKALAASGAPIIIQKFCRASHDKRVILFDGVVLGAYARIPAEGDFRANISQGGKVVATSLDAVELNISKKVAQDAKEKSIAFVGLDLLGEYVTEINVTSPSGLLELRDLYGIDTQKLFWDYCEGIVERGKF